MFDRYYHAKRRLIKSIGKSKVNERYVFHGAKEMSVMETISREGFRNEFSTIANYGEGTYFARDAKYCVPWFCAYDKHDRADKLFCCLVLMGESIVGREKYKLREWPKKNGGQGLLYDSLVDDPNDPSVFVIHENARAYPMFIIHIR